MKINNYHKPVSSFLSVEKDTNIIIDKFLKDDILKRLLIYTDKNPLKHDDIHLPIDEKTSIDMLGKQIKIVPQIQVDPTVLNYVLISFDGFVTNENNPEFRNNSIIFDIVCHHDQWQLPDLQLRPFRIAAQIDTIMTNTELTNMGKIYFAACNQVLINDEFSGFSLMYNVIHGGEDKVDAPIGNQELVNQFNKLFNGQ